jgi:hypothetical protein
MSKMYVKILPSKLLIILSLCMLYNSIDAQAVDKSRVIILSDIEADPDDTQSFIRLFLYANQIDIKGMIATTSCWQKNRIAPESIHKLVNAYRKVQPNLLKHAVGFPTSVYLNSIIKSGQPTYGMDGVGEGKDTEGSNWIIKVLEEKDERPLWISVWGGSNTLAQALFKLKNSKTQEQLDHLIAKLRVYTISDQDDSGIWLRNTFPGLFYVVSPGDYYFSSTWSSINGVHAHINNASISNDWFAQNIQQGHGPLGSTLPDVSWGVEGDTPAFLSLIPNGLNFPERPDWGGWGGRYELYKPEFVEKRSANSGVPLVPETRAIWTDAIDEYIPFLKNDYGRPYKLDSITIKDNKVTLWRWRDDFQNDFAARMDWCTMTYKEANHPPVPKIKPTKQNFTVHSGETIFMDSSDSFDPDGDNISVHWYIYPEAGTYKGKVNLSTENYPSITWTAPKVEKEETIHVILKVTDKGTPALSRYLRSVVTVVP